jgi:uncharacterized protein (TIGR02996 family)
MNHEDAFLQTIVDAPDDDAPRLIFADWLDEHGDPRRAAFIRAQCRLAKLPEECEERYRLEAEEAALLAEMTGGVLDRNHPRWANVPGRWVKDKKPSFERGFVAKLDTTATRFFAHADRVMQAAPIQHLTLGNALYKFEELQHSPHLSRLRSLAITHQRLPDNAVAALVSEPALSGLKALDLTRNRFRIKGAEAIAGSPHLGGLQRLVLNVCYVHDRGPEALAASPHLAGLKRLELAECQIGPRGATALAKSKHLANLEWLDLGQNRLDEAGARALADASGLPNLRHLDVSSVRVRPDGLRALLQNGGLKRLTTLCATLYSADWRGFWSVEPSAHLRGRLELRLNGWEDLLTDEFHDSRLLAACAGLSFLDYGRLGDKGAMKLVASPALAGLRSLELRQCDLTDRTAVAIGQSPHLKGLTRLALPFNRLTRVGIEALVAGPLGRRLTHLDLGGWGIRDDVAEGLTKAKGLDQMERLGLAGLASEHWRAALRERYGWRVTFG